MKSKILLLIITLSVTSASADVSLKNGNFHVSYTDLYWKSPIQFSLERVYNSKAGFSGIFGIGWGSNLEHYMRVSVSGEIYIAEYGAGAMHYFSDENRADFHDSLRVSHEKLVIESRLADILKNNAAINQDSFRLALKKKYLGDRASLESDWEDYAKKNKLTLFQHEPGTTFISYEFGEEIVVRNKNGYTRIYGDGLKQFFDSDGRLVRIEEEGTDYHVTMEYKDQNIVKVFDNTGNYISLFYNNLGKVERILDQDGRVCIYHYDRNKVSNLIQLIYSSDVEANQYEFEYDARTNITQIRYKDDTSIRIDYYDRSALENVKTVTDQYGYTTTYKYQRTNGDLLVSTRETSVFSDDVDVIEYVYKDFDDPENTFLYSKIVYEKTNIITYRYDKNGKELERKKTKRSQP